EVFNVSLGPFRHLVAQCGGFILNESQAQPLDLLGRCLALQPNRDRAIGDCIRQFAYTGDSFCSEYAEIPGTKIWCLTDANGQNTTSAVPRIENSTQVFGPILIASEGNIALIHE